MEEVFKNWLLNRGNPAAATSYPRAIPTISEHYSAQTGVNTDIYRISDQATISQLAQD